MIKVKIKRLAQLLPKSSQQIKAGVYEITDYPQNVWDYQKELNNYQELELDTTIEESSKSNFTLISRVEDQIKTKPKTRRKS
jgi:hypothetical protein